MNTQSHAAGPSDTARAPGTRAQRWATTLLGALLLAQGVGKVIDLEGYGAALAAFDVWPPGLIGLASVLWTAGELIAGVGLLAAGLAATPPRKMAYIAACLGLATAIGYALLTTQAYARGLDVANCTCFGVYLPQRLSVFVLAQDAYMLVYTGWQVAKTRRWLVDSTASS